MKINTLILTSFFIITFSDSYSQTIINDLQQLESYHGDDYVYLKGYITHGDNGRGYYLLKDTNLSSNNGTIFNSPIPTKKWFRVYDGKININWFKSNGNISDRLAINKAIQYAISQNKNIYIPDGEYFIHNDEFINIENINSLSITGEGERTVLNVNTGYQSVFKINSSSNITISNLKIKGTRDSGVAISNNSESIKLSKITFEQLSSASILLFDCSKIQIQECVFLNTAYQILQRSGHSSDDVLVNQCISRNCKNDFIELDSEKEAPSKNWVITNNLVKNIGLDSSDSTRVESRFIGVTNTDGILISNNTIENTAGDATFHFEGFTGKVIITNNIIKNPHGRYGRLIFNIGGNSIATSKRHINFSNNYVEINKSFLDDSDKLIISSDIDSTRMNIKDNIFVNNSNDTNINLIAKSETKELWNIFGNEFKNFNTAISLGKNSGHTYIAQNRFLNCTNGIKVSERADGNSSLSVENNSFKNINNVYNDIYRKINILKFTGNILNNSMIDLNMNLLQGNIFIASNTTYKDYQQVENIQKGVETQIFKINDKNYNILCWIEISSPGAADTVKDLVRFTRHHMYLNVYGNKVEIVSRHRTGVYPEPIYNIDENGLNVTINGNNIGPFKTDVRVINSKN
ncbi:MAG: right-handed parallel beta-helix repeat-containing protein [Flavobacteriaceae bacterium]|nr:right-handed parallel beta-helix repeat-containing protein [Flavobacteriaceae bacterium]